MGYNLLENIQYCREFVTSLQSLLLYSHFFPAIVGLIVGIYVFLKKPELLLSKIFLGISALFAGWVSLNLLIWFGYNNSGMLMTAWSLIEIFSVLLFIFVIYFIYALADGKDVSPKIKLLWVIIVLPIFAFAITKFNLQGFDLQECVAIENPLYATVRFYLKIGLIVWLVSLILFKMATRPAVRKELSFIGIGTLAFLFSFFISGYISETTENYTFELYGLFGMIIFIASLAYSIVRFKLFQIQLLGAQALVITLSTLIGAQFFFIQNDTNRVLNGATFVLSILFGFFLVRGVKRDLETRKQLELLANNLKHANTRLKELDNQKTEFISLATHQIRGPLGSIKGYLSMILEGDFGDFGAPLKTALETIQKSAQSLIIVVNDYLDVSRIEQGRMKFDMTDFDVKDLTATVINEQRPVIEKAKLSIDFTCADNQTFKTRGDIGKIKQVIGNLLDNSIKYTPAGSLHVYLEKKEDNKILISIKDTGVGIKPEVLPLLFQKFTRAPDASKTNILGTGLGLFVARKIIEAHKGKVWAESEGQDKGSQFYIELAGV